MANEVNCAVRSQPSEQCTRIEVPWSMRAAPCPAADCWRFLRPRGGVFARVVQRLLARGAAARRPRGAQVERGVGGAHQSEAPICVFLQMRAMTWKEGARKG